MASGTPTHLVLAALREAVIAWTKRNIKRSYPCNVVLLEHLRERKGWTQKQLAAVAGYSERLISKAESGRPLSPAAIDDLAGALSGPDMPVYPEDLISDPLALAKEFIAAHYLYQKEMFDAVRHFIDAEIVHIMAGDPAVIPFAGERRGIDEVENVFDLFWSIMEAPAGIDYERCYKYLSQGNEVVIWAESWLHPIGQPMKEPMRYCQRLQFRRSMLLRVEVVFDTQYGEKVLQSESP